MKNLTWKKIKEFFSTFETKDIGVRYCIDVFCFEKYIVSNYVKKAVMRHLLFIYKSIHDKNFPFFYDVKSVQLAYAFYKVQLIPESRKPYILAPYRAFMLSVIVGLRFKNRPEKIITQEIMDTEGRKNGKSTFWAIFANFVSCSLLNDYLPTIFISGAGEKSSKILYRLSQNLINFNPVMKSEFSKVNQLVTRHKLGGEIVKLPFMKEAIEGQNPSLVILTEFHLHPDNRMQESARTARNESRNNQLIVYDTTKGQHLHFPYFDLEKTFKLFLDEQIDNPEKLVDNWNIFLFCAELDFEKYDEWDNPKWWAQANPNVGITLSLEAIEKEFKMLVNKVDLNDFKIKKIGMWLNQTEAYFDIFDIQKSQEQNREIYEEYFVKSTKWKELNCILGLDLSNTDDTTALVETYEIDRPDGESIWIIKHKGFIPLAKAQEKVKIDRVPYFKWQEKDFLKIVKGDVIDYKEISNEISSICDRVNVSKLAYDPWQFRFLKDKVVETSYLRDEDLIPVKQNSNLTPSIKEFERKLHLKKVFIVDDNEMLINHILNVALKPSKNISNIYYPEKVQYNARVDGAIAMFTALYERAGISSTAGGGEITNIIV